VALNNALRNGRRPSSLSCRRLANFGSQVAHVAIRFAEKLAPFDFRSHSVLQ
jgi:hypothetical protein